MILPNSLAKEVPSYQAALEDLERNFNRLRKGRDYQKKQIALLSEFTRKYFMVRDIWEHFMYTLEDLKNAQKYYGWPLDHQKGEKFEKEHQEALKMARYQFFYDIDEHRLRDIRNQLSSFKKSFVIDEDEWRNIEWVNYMNAELNWPNSRIEKNHDIFQKTSSTFIPKKLENQINALKALQKVAIDAKEKATIQEWLECLKETQNEKFIKYVVETRIFENPFHRKLWKLYIAYLKEVDPNEMLQCYSKYCRLFLNDQETKKEYQQEVQKYGGTVAVPWSNLFEFERYADVKKIPSIYEMTIVQRPLSHDPLKITNKILNPKPQKFNAFPSPLMKHVLSNARPQVWLKLHQTCQYFLTKYPYPICYRLIRCYQQNQHHSFRDNSIALGRTNIPLKSKIHLVNTLYFESNNENDLSTIIAQMLYKCTARHIYIQGQTLSIEDFKFLIGHGNVETLTMWRCRVFKPDNTAMNHEEYLQMLPNIRSFRH